MATFKDADPNTPGIQIKRGPGGVLQNEVKEKAKKVAKFTGNPNDYMRAIRSTNLPKDVIVR